MRNSISRLCLVPLGLSLLASGSLRAWEEGPENKAAFDKIKADYEKVFKLPGGAIGERVKLDTNIVEEVLKGEGGNPVAHDCDKNRPSIWFMGGGGASGKGFVKSFLQKNGHLKLPDGTVMIDPDDLKSKLPEYQKVIDAEDRNAAALVHEESSLISKKIYEEAVKNKRDIVFDVTLGNPLKAVAQLTFKDHHLKDTRCDSTVMDAGLKEWVQHIIAMPEAEKKGCYIVHLIGVTTDIATATDRAIDRAKGNPAKNIKKSNRWVPMAELLKAHKGFATGFFTYAELVDSAELYDTTTEGADPVLVLTSVHTKDDNKYELKDKDKLNAFLEKTAINLHATKKEELFDVHHAKPAIKQAADLHTIDSNVQACIK
jgi:hypothetical protein